MSRPKIKKLCPICNKEFHPGKNGITHSEVIKILFYLIGDNIVCKICRKCGHDLFNLSSRNLSNYGFFFKTEEQCIEFCRKKLLEKKN